MPISAIHQPLNASGEQMILLALWGGLALLTIALLVLMRTRWGQSQPLRKCAFISVLAHLLLAGYATTVKIVATSGSSPSESAMVVRAVDTVASTSDAEQPTAEQPKPWERIVEEDLVAPENNPLQRDEPLSTEAVQRHAPAADNKLVDAMPLADVPPTNVETPKPGEIAEVTPRPNEAAKDIAATLEAPMAKKQEAPAEPRPDLAVQAERSTLPLPNLPAPQRVLRSEDSLLKTAVPLPRIAHRATVAQPAPSSEALVDDLRNRSRPEPAAPAPSDKIADDALANDSGELNPTEGQSLSSSQTTAKETPSGMTDRPKAEPEPVAVVKKYELRMSADRFSEAIARGATPESEDAVNAALDWLARVQSSDGPWDASSQRAGREQLVSGHDRGGAGTDADTGITALALLAFLGAGNTHQSGEHKQTVAAALEFLKSQQAADGNLGGGARNFAFMYCHGMAALAVSEAYGMTHDPELEPMVRGAIAYTLSAQHPRTGGWRYRPWQHRPNDGGDASQMGWQLMALTSADLAGIKMPPTARDGTVQFLKRVAVGPHGGRACYRPDEQVSHTMTAEALYCRQLLGMARDNPASDEAGEYLLGKLPGAGKRNLYYWYYGTLAMYQLGGPYWESWNQALQKSLVPVQSRVGTDAGSWSPNTVWGGYGGRIYSTAMSTLCLEVYYRYLPVYGDPRVEPLAAKPLEHNRVR